MTHLLPYGTDAAVELSLPPDQLVAACGEPRGVPLTDVAARLREVLATPLDYPSLAQIAMPGDRIVLALEPGLPRGVELAAAIVEFLVASGVQPDGISILRTQADADLGGGDPRPHLASDVAAAIHLLTHDPDSQSDLAYLATTDRGAPILLHRALVDADVVLPLSCARDPAALDYYGVHGVIYPTFADRAAQAAYRAPRALRPRGETRKQLTATVAEVGWLLGLMFAIEIIPGAGEEILEVLAGQTESIARRGRQLHRQAWACSAPSQASLVMVAIPGGPSQQTWQNLGRALAVALPLVEEGGAIAICSDLAMRPGPAVQQLAGARSRQEAMRQIEHERPEDTLPAELLARAQEQGTVYLLSRLSENLLEDLDLASVTDPVEMSRLAQRHGSCILLANGPHVSVKLTNGESS